MQPEATSNEITDYPGGYEIDRKGGGRQFDSDLLEFFSRCHGSVPLIIYDPSKAADPSRGTTCDALVEAIDIAATAIEVQGGENPAHIVEGRSLLRKI